MTNPKIEIIPFDVDQNWPEPDMSIVQSERPAAHEMTRAEFDEVFGDWAPWIFSSAEVKSAHPDYVALALITTASALIGNSRRAHPWDGWVEATVLWGMLIGDPSSGKSPSLDAVLDPLKHIEKTLALKYKRELADWEDKHEIAQLVCANWKSNVKAALAAGDSPPAMPKDARTVKAPIRKRIQVSDITTEKVTELLADTWRGLLQCRDELSGWLSSMDRYSNGGDRPFWLEAHGGRSYSVDRKSHREPLIVDHLSVSVLGGAQPEKFDELLLRSKDDGLVARFLMVFPEPPPLARPSAKLDEATPLRAFERLFSLEPATDDAGAPQPMSVPFDEDARSALQDFRSQCRDWGDSAHGPMKSHMGKLPGLAARVSLILALMDWSIGHEPEPVQMIDARLVRRARKYVGEHLRLHAERACRSSVPTDIRGAKRIADYILSKNLTVVGQREIQRCGFSGLDLVSGIRAAIQVLIEAEWLEPIESKGQGRKPIKYSVNPRVRCAK